MFEQFKLRIALGALCLGAGLAVHAAPTPAIPASAARPTSNVTGGGGGTTGVVNYFEQNILIRSGETVEALGPTLMGDSVNEFSGGLEFTHIDVSLPGNNALLVAAGRHLAAGTRQAHLTTGLFGDWDLEIPHLRTIAAPWYGGAANWFGNGLSGTPSLNRCSQFQPPPSGSAYAVSKYITAPPNQWWDGYHMVIPGAGDQTMLLRAPGNATQPTDGYAYPIVTKQHWQVRCLSSLENGSGEAFLALSPDGTRYRFDHLVSRIYPTFKTGGNGVLSRSELWILPTQITDRFGNWVRYSYGGVDGWRVMSITSSDGRAITFGYSGNGNRIQTVSDGTRTWSYAYDGAGALQTVTQPDGSQWQFALSDIERDPFSSPDPDCDYGDGPPPAPWDNITRVGSIVHPSGATGTFGLRMTLHGRSNVPGSNAACAGPVNIGGTVYANGVSRYFTNYSLTSKTLSGPGMPAMTWSYAYSAASGSFAPCNGCVSTKTVTITDPNNNVVQSTYGTQFGVNDGLLLGSSEGALGGGTLRSTSYAYRASNVGPYPAKIGNFAGMSDTMTPNSMAAIHTPQSRRDIVQQSVTFTQNSPNTSDFDVYARTVNVTRFSSQGTSRTDSTGYADYTNLWVLGQVASRTIAGVQAASTSFNGATALPIATYKFGKLQATYAFNGDGTLASITDGLSHSTGFGSYARGLPQRVDFADGKFITGVVHNIGVLASTTNEAGTTWSYTYDPIGRLASKTPPGGDPVAYNSTTLSFVQVPYDEYGLGAGHWRQTITTGNAVTVNWFDARWRKRLTTTYDAADPGGTLRMQRFDYDAYNRTIFAAYPTGVISSIAQIAPGVTTQYDALGRPTRVIADSELGPLTTITQYLDGFTKKVINPRGFETTMAYQAFDEPSESAITNITAPEGVSVTIARDVFGKPNSITRGGAFYGSGPASVTRSYGYDANQLLCKTIEPEIGATVQSLDAANNVSWRAIGLNLPSTTSCDTASVPANKIVGYTYDPRNRLTGTGFGDGSPSIGRAYTPDGLPSTIVSAGSTLGYSYNNRRLMTSEVLDARAISSGWIWGFTHTYDPNGHETGLWYPDGAMVAYSPNALGEAKQVSGFASNITYQYSGAVAGYTLGISGSPGIVHAFPQNTRGLPSRIVAAGVMDDLYTYDGNGNVATITDSREGVTNRSMGYDGLDRLIAANAPGVWGSATYSYDALDNLRTSFVGSRNSWHNYDANNRLGSINTNGAYTGYSYDAQGNVNGRGAQGFYFDQGNRMTLAAGKASYAYDGLGRRIINSSADGQRMLSYYSQSGQVLFQQHQQGTAVQNIRHVYLAGKQIAEVDSTYGTTFFHNDALGSPVAKTNASGALISRTRYEPYGNTAAGTVPNGIGFTGHVNDPDTGLVYMQQRYYDPVAGRFSSVDPITTDAGSGNGFNRYEYSRSNPYKFLDRDGRDAVIAWQANGSINISIPITFSGPGATATNIQAIKNDIRSTWSGTYSIGGANREVTVQVLEGTLDGVNNSINLTNGPTSNRAGGASFVRGGNSGEWDMTAPGMQNGNHEAAHEAGHLMLEGDHYTESRGPGGERVTPPNTGYENNVMGTTAPGARGDSRNMERIIQNPKNPTLRQRIENSSKKFGRLS